MKKAVTSCAFGANHEKMARISYPTFARYARRIGADFVPFTERKFPDRNAHIEKFQIRDLLDSYDSVMWLDCDTLISKFACSIYDHVPMGHFAAVDECAYSTLMNVPLELQTVAAALGVPIPSKRPFVYFNSGVFVCWKEHRPFFENVPASIPTPHGLDDQTVLNLRVGLSGTPFTALPQTWNMLWVPVEFELAHIVHFAGRTAGGQRLEDMAQLAKMSSFADTTLGERM